MAHIKTTHVGSLPRGEELTPLLLARDAGKPYDAADFDAKVGAAVKDAVRHQVDAGVSIVSDGELGKVGYSTYMIERLSGFGGHIDRKPAADLAEVPGLAKKLSAIMGSQEFVRASCIGPVKLVTLEPLTSAIAEEVDTVFVPENSRLARIRVDESGEMLLDAEGADSPETFSGDRIDVGAVAEEFFELAIDPYPRKPGLPDAAEPRIFGEGEGGEGPVSPFAKLSDWRGKS